MFYERRGYGSGDGGRLTAKSTGTTTVGVLFDSGVVLATDRRVTAGYFIAHHQGKKIHQIDGHVGMTISGVVADAQALIDILRYNTRIYRVDEGRPMPVRSVAMLASNLMFSYRLYPLIADVLIGGVDERPGLYNIDIFGSISSDRFMSTGSGSPIAYGVLEPGYRDGMGRDEAISLAVKAVHYAMKRDSASGDGIDVTVVDGGGYGELGFEEKSKVIAALG